MMAKNNKKDWSGVCATTNNRNQCGENCTLFPICKIKIPQDELKEKLKEPLLKKGIIRSDEQMLRFIDKIFGGKK